MKIRVLGSGAGGGFPQWNCNCDNCKGFKQGTIKAKARTQSSIALSEDGKQWILFNASPDIRQQILQTPELQPTDNLRESGIRAVVLVDSQIDHTTGLLLLREGKALHLYATSEAHHDLSTHHPILKVLEHYTEVDYHEIKPDVSFKIPGFESIDIKPIDIVSEAPPYSPNRGNPVVGTSLGFVITNLANQKTMFYSPGLGEVNDDLKAVMSDCDIVLIDGTFWTEDEMITKGVGDKKASQMGHLCQSGDKGMLSVLNQLEQPRKILIHINNTNPILNEESDERAQLTKNNVEVSYDQMELDL